MSKHNIGKKLKGTGVALVTPFTKNLKIDFDGLRNLINYTSTGGVDYFVVLGTTGESPTLSKEEKKDILEFVKKNNKKKLPIVYGMGGNNTEEIIESFNTIELNGITALLSVSPYYNKPTQTGIIKHYEKLADSSPLPLILYNVPGRTSSNLTASTTLTLSQHQNIIGIKEASGDLLQCMCIAQQKPSDFLLLSGDDLLTMPMIAIGATGVISVLANAFPKKFTTMVNKALQGKFSEAAKQTFEFLSINTLMYHEGNPTGIKAALHIKKVCEDYMRLPLLKASKELKEKIKSNSSHLE